MGRSPLFRLLPGRAEESRSATANQRAASPLRGGLQAQPEGETGRWLPLAFPAERADWLAAMRRPADVTQRLAAGQSRGVGLCPLPLGHGRSPL